METTKLIIEYVVGGVVVSLALLLFAWSLFPAEVQQIVVLLDQSQSPALTTDGIVIALFAAIIYAVGVISEFVGELVFRRRFNRVRRKRFREYLDGNRELLDGDPILGRLASNSFTKRELGAVAECVGQMRFHVLMKSPSLYTDIESQLNRLRLIRVLFLAEVILTAAIIVQLIRQVSAPLVGALVLILVIGFANWQAVGDRFERYNRSIERAYKALRLPSSSDAAQTERPVALEQDDSVP